MKKNKTKKIMLFTTIFLTIISFNIKAKAEQICKLYRDYDLFAEVTGSSSYNEAMSQNNMYYVFTETQTPAGLSKEADLINEYQVEIIKSGTSTDKKWTLVDYYNHLYNIYNSGERQVLTTPTGDTNILVYTTTEGETENGEPIVVRYIKHGKWNTEGKEENEKGFTLESLFKSSIDVLVNASVIPTGNLTKLEGTGTKIKSVKSGDFYNIQIERKILPSDIEGLEFVNATLIDGETQDILTADVLIAPAVYYREYEYCEEIEGKEETYKAQIDYVYIDGSEAAASYTEKEISVNEKSYTNEIASPNIKKCTPDREKVTISIDKDKPADFYEKVVYTCRIDEEPKENEKTGSILIYIVWVIGIAAISYSVYYFIKLNKSQVK